MTNQQAEPLYRQVRAQLMRELTLDVDVLPRLTLVGRARLQALHRQTAVDAGANLPPGGDPQHLQGFFHRVNDQQNIYIEHYLPQVQFQSVAAHELTHAWQATHVPHNQPEKIVEGFAEWVAYSILQVLGEREEAERLTKRNDIYGEGLRYFLDLERKHGRSAVIQRAKQAG
jgi:Peptidase of plants and bacteria